MHRSGQFGTADQLLTCLRTNEIVALKDIWQYMINCDAVWEGVVEDGPVVSKRLVAADYFVEPLGLNVDGAILPVNSIVFDATLKIYHPHMPFVEASDYVAPTGSTAGQPFAKIAQWKSEGESLISELTIVAFRPPIQSSLDTGAEADDQGPPGAS